MEQGRRYPPFVDLVPIERQGARRLFDEMEAFVVPAAFQICSRPTQLFPPGQANFTA
jgi:hypothetical protein